MKTMIFDLGNVLVFFSFPKMISQMATCTGLSPEKIQDILSQNLLRDQYERGQVSSVELYNLFQQKAPKSFTAQDFFYASSDIFTSNEPMVPLLKALKKKGMRLVLLSNTSDAHYSFLLPRYPVLQLFDEKILSFEAKACKPDPKIYTAALKAAKALPQECFYTDDILEYVEAGRLHGLDAEVFTDAKTLQKQLALRGIEL